jgi:hypothetical protein
MRVTPTPLCALGPSAARERAVHDADVGVDALMPVIRWPTAVLCAGDAG